MKKIKLILKGVLLYITAFVLILWLCAVDSLMDNGIFFESMLPVIGLCLACYFYLSKEEIEILTFDKYFN